MQNVSLFTWAPHRLGCGCRACGESAWRTAPQPSSLRFFRPENLDIHVASLAIERLARPRSAERRAALTCRRFLNWASGTNHVKRWPKACFRTASGSSGSSSFLRRALLKKGLAVLTRGVAAAPKAGEQRRRGRAVLTRLREVLCAATVSWPFP